jgi:hypothetical protein
MSKAKATAPLAANKAKEIAGQYYNAGTVKFDLLVALMTCKYPQDQRSLQLKVNAERITNRINEIVEETPIRINRTKAIAGFDTNGKPVNLYSYAG